MEERKLNEKESLELITRMIRNTKHNLEIGDGNIFLFWGYLTVTSTAIVYLLLQLTENLMSYLAFLLIIDCLKSRLTRTKCSNKYGVSWDLSQH